jgi:tetratricopeptide (TPR) repeat protein
MNAPGIRLSAVRLPPISVLVVVAALVALSPAFARAAGSSEEARVYFDKATASFALGYYSVAAENFEKAFAIRPDSALLYNAAQAHRLAGNKERALILYQNYLRLYTKAPLRAEIEARVEELKKAIERDRVVATTPPSSTLPLSMSRGSGPAVSSAAPPAPIVDLRPRSPSAPRATLVAQAQPAPSEPLTSKPLFWVAVAGGIAAVTVVVLVAALSGDRNPSPSLGRLR